MPKSTRRAFAGDTNYLILPERLRIRLGWTKYSLVLGVALCCFLANGVRAATDADLKASIASLQTKLASAQAKATSATKSQASLIAKLQATNATKTALFVAGVSTATAGQSVTVPIAFIQSSTPIAGLQADMSIPSGFTMLSLVAGPAAVAAGKGLQFATTNGITRMIVFGVNTAVIGSGVLAIATFSIPSTAAKGFYSIGMTNPVASDAAGNSVSLSGTSGTVQIK